MPPINPIAFANKVNEQFQNYQLTAFPLADPDLYDQAYRSLTDSGASRPLIKGPYISLSRSFKMGSDLKNLAKDGTVHDALAGMTEFTRLFRHQERAFTEILKGNHCLVSTGTGSGKTESFLYPILNHCLKLRDSGEGEGIAAIVVYPMNALAIDQRNRLREMLAGSGISFGLYIGQTSAGGEDLNNIVRLRANEGRDIFKKKQLNAGDKTRVIPFEERLTEKEINETPPRILLTNVKQLELLMTRPKDFRLFTNSKLRFIVIDEAHTYSGVAGAEVSCLIRRLRTLCGKNADEVLCIGTSATIIDPDLGDDAGKRFASRFFGIDENKVSLVQEEYEAEEFPQERFSPPVPGQNTFDILKAILESIESGDPEAIGQAYQALTGTMLTPGNNVHSALFEQLKMNEFIYKVFTYITEPQELKEAAQRVRTQLNRRGAFDPEQDQGELLCYLALGAAAVKNNIPLLRPKIHYFVKGLEGAVLVFEKPVATGIESLPKLFLSKESAFEKMNVLDSAYFPLFVCKNCGQHYFEAYFNMLELHGNTVSGGQAEKKNVIWSPAGESSGSRAILTNRFVVELDEEEELQRLNQKRTEMSLCSYCGTLHRDFSDECHNPKCKQKNTLVKVWLMTKMDDGILSSCPACNSSGKAGGRRNAPIRPLKATTVSDVHILAQNMINNANAENRKLIVFADSRQEAAFQAGWMLDHARRYRFRHIVFEILSKSDSPVSIGDIQQSLMERLKRDKSLARVLAPEVYELATDEAFSKNFDRELQYYLRIQIVRELATSFSQRESLENWGLLKVVYAGINAENNFVRMWAQRRNIPAEDLADGISALLDVYRRNRYFYDYDAPLFSRSWSEGDPEIQRGYLNLMMASNNKPLQPKGISEEPENPKNTYKVYFRSGSNKSLVEGLVSKMGVGEDFREEFLHGLWEMLTRGTGVLKQVSLVNNKNRALATGSPLFQVDSSKIGMISQSEMYRCSRCQRNHTRMTPKMVCTAHNCRGTLKKKEPRKDDYNVSLLKSEFTMVLPHEHSSQVKGEVREQVEIDFKSQKGHYNCLVATPTLELGVDIGALDMVLMRNVPPGSSNYWQRAGRAGRRNRIAVIYTYSRRNDHDSYFYRDPEKILSGSIKTPKFNLENEIMLRKHVHSTVISHLLRVASDEHAKSVRDDLRTVFPNFIKAYLFTDEGEFLTKPVNVSPLRKLVESHKKSLLAEVRSVFNQYWPDDAAKLDDAQLESFISDMPDNLQEVINLLHQRLIWALETRQRLSELQKAKLLEQDDEKTLNRCNAYLKALNTETQENYTLTVLANEGFLPGYGLYDNGVKAFAHLSFLSYGRGKAVFELSRSKVMALREYIPGNLIYANNGRFKSVLYRFPADMEDSGKRTYRVNLEQNHISTGSPAGAVGYNDTPSLEITSVPISDVDIHLLSRISDEEANRFQMSVRVIGKLQGTRKKSLVYRTGDRRVALNLGQKVLLLNLGPEDRVSKLQPEPGYPVCTACGAARSPYASQLEIDAFLKYHTEKCGKTPSQVAFSSEEILDGIHIKGFESHVQAQNLGEALLLGASRILEMERSDLGLLFIGEGDGSSSLYIYDPMPGGSGILRQMIEKWEELTEEANIALSQCPAQCESSCYECLRTYHNSFYHKNLDRRVAAGLISGFMNTPVLEEELGPVTEDRRKTSDDSSTNSGEKTFAEILDEAGFPAFKQQVEIKIGPPHFSTTPDFYYENAEQGIAVVIYLDGLSKSLHGNADRARVDQIIRTKLELLGYKVVEVPSSALNDPMMLDLKKQEIAMKMGLKQ